MKIKRIRSIRINSFTFRVVWRNDNSGGFFSYADRVIEIGTKRAEERIFEILCHELMEICAVDMGVRLDRPDCDSDYIFVYDHRQHTTMMAMFSSLVSQFIA